jgi:hypothetical protein
VTDTFYGIIAAAIVSVMICAMSHQDIEDSSESERLYCQRVQDAIQASPSRNWPEAVALYRRRCGDLVVK